MEISVWLLAGVYVQLGLAGVILVGMFIAGRVGMARRKKLEADDPVLNKLRAGVEYVRAVEAGESPTIH